jgi:hypothetical protein
MDIEFMKWLATLGIGGVLAGFMFIFYRKDIKQFTELWKTSTEVLMEVVNKNTSSYIKLITILESIEREAVKLSDIKELMRQR